METQTNVDALFRAALNRHGYGFQYAIIKEAQSLQRRGESGWIPWAPEFPVQIQDSNTRIDLLLQHQCAPLLLVAECKRANPATAKWCFARGWQPDKAVVSSQSYVEIVYWYDEGEGFETSLKELVHSDRIYQIGLEVRTNEKGNDKGSGRGEIEEAATQVCRGLNGLIQMFHDRRSDLLKLPEYKGFVPVIFTTAKLFSTDTDIGNAELQSGNLEEFSAPLQERDWLWYDYPQSPGLKHSIPAERASADLRDVLFQDYIRRIAIVNPTGLKAFLNMSAWQVFGV